MESFDQYILSALCMNDGADPAISALDPLSIARVARRYSPEFFAGDPLDVAPALIGATLVHTSAQGKTTAGIVVETEAYRGEEDQACHARVGRTKRTSTMYGPPGRAYVYLIYGMYHMMNVVTWPAGQPSAVLIRALTPIGLTTSKTDGPGKLCRALGIDRTHNGADLSGETLFLIPPPESGMRMDTIAAGPRVGIDYAGSWAKKPWRFALRDSPYVSKPRL